PQPEPPHVRFSSAPRSDLQYPSLRSDSLRWFALQAGVSGPRDRRRYFPSTPVGLGTPTPAGFRIPFAARAPGFYGHLAGGVVEGHAWHSNANESGRSAHRVMLA